VGNVSPTAQQNLTIDTTAPGTPQITSPDATNDVTPVITGTAEPNSKVTITVDVNGVTSTVEVTSNGSGNWNVDLGTATPTTGTTPTLTDGSTATITAIATNAVGNASGASAPQTLTVDTGAPGVPTITSLDLVNTVTPTITGTDEPGSTVTLGIDTNNDGTPEATYEALVDGSGNWSVNLATATPVTGTAPTLTDGSQVKLTATATNPVGNVSSPAKQNLTVDTAAPGAPQITSPDATNDVTPVIAGTAEPNSKESQRVESDRIC
jgi:hypothetical protein